MMRTLAKFNGIHDPKINLIQGNKIINQLDHNAYTWRWANEV
jgi:hypothetical protein